MKISTFIKRLERLKQKHGDLNVVIATNPDLSDNSVDKHVCMITWHETKSGKHKAHSLMLCDRSTAQELS